MSATTWNRARVPNPWRARAIELGIDKAVAHLIATFVPKIGVKARALTHVGIIDLLEKASRMKD